MGSVFLSYASEDQDLAIWLQDSLRAGAVDVWRDRDNIVRGKLLARIIAATKECDYGVFLVSSHWQASEWCHKEAQLWSERDGAADKMILVELEPHKTLSTWMPPELSQLVGIDCGPSADRNEALWRIYCAVTDRDDLGDPKAYRENGRKLAVGSAPLVLVTSREGACELRTSEAVEVLECGRETEFALVRKRYEDKLHHHFIIAGSENEGHEYFVDRIDALLKCEPPHSAERLVWPRDIRPRREPVYREHLARALRSTPDLLAGRMRELMHFKNLILIHPIIKDEYEDPSLVDCLTKWLPNLVHEVNPAQKLKCVQPIGWAAAKNVLWFGEAEDEAPLDVRKVMAEIRNVPNDFATEEVTLTPITIQNVRDFCRMFTLSNDDENRLLARIREKKARKSEQILRIIERFMDERREQRAAG